MTIETALQWAQKELRDFAHPSLESEVLLAGLLQKDRIFLKTYGDFRLSLWQYFLYKKFVHKRKKYIPVAYILGFKNFGGLRIFVNNQVLIPRDETEILCQHIVDAHRDNIPQRILDVGSGSGCISLFLGLIFPHAEITAIDISSQALAVARKNSEFHKRDIRFLQSDLLENLPETSFFDVIVANLPYVPQHMPVSFEVRQEPAWALFSGQDGLSHIRNLASQFLKKNIKFSELWLEFLPSQKEKILEIFTQDQKKYSVEFFTDTAGDVFFAKIEGKSF